MIREIKGYEGLYSIDTDGNVYRHTRYGMKLKKPSMEPTGYMRIRLCKDGKPTSKLVHRLVAETFIPNPDNLPQVNHKDKNKQNNNVSNLEWVTALENIRHSRDRKVRCIDTGVIYPSIRDAAKAIGYKYQCEIRKACRGVRNRAAGYKWEYVEEDAL